MSTVDLVASAAHGGAPSRPRGKRARWGHPLLLFVVRRVLAGAATLLVVSALIFGAVQILPGDVAATALGRNATAERVTALRAELNLDDPVVVRYVHWLGDMVTGDFGVSTAALAQGRSEPVGATLGPAIRNSGILALVTLLLFVPLCLLLGTTAALRRGRLSDRAISNTALTLGSLPEFLVGTVLIYALFTQLDLLPPLAQVGPGETPLSHPDALVMPVATLLTANLALGIRLVRATTLDVLRENYVMMAQLNGISRWRVTMGYVLRNALAPNVQVLAYLTTMLFASVIITESVFSFPGVGSQLVSAVSSRDIQVVSVIGTIAAAFCITVNIIADLVATLLVPKLRTEVMQ